jgi:hypothetical protein
MSSVWKMMLDLSLTTNTERRVIQLGGALKLMTCLAGTRLSQARSTSGAVNRMADQRQRHRTLMTAHATKILTRLKRSARVAAASACTVEKPSITSLTISVQTTTKILVNAIKDLQILGSK